MIKPIVVAGYDSPDVFKRKKLDGKDIVDLNVLDLVYEGFTIGDDANGNSVLLVLYSAIAVSDEEGPFSHVRFFPINVVYSIEQDDIDNFDQYYSDNMPNGSTLGIITTRFSSYLTKCSAIHTHGKEFRFIVKGDEGRLFCLNMNTKNATVIGYCENCLCNYVVPDNEMLDAIYSTDIEKDFYYIHNAEHPITIEAIYKTFNTNLYWVRFTAYSSRTKTPVRFKYGPFELSRRDTRALKKKSKMTHDTHDIVMDLNDTGNPLQDNISNDYIVIPELKEVYIRHKSFGDTFTSMPIQMAFHINADGNLVKVLLKMHGVKSSIIELIEDMNKELIKFIES